MNIYKNIGILAICCFSLWFVSCKKAGKETMMFFSEEYSEKVTKEVTEETTQEFFQEASAKKLKALTKKELRSIDAEELIDLIRKENLNFSAVFDRLDGTLQKKLANALQTDHDFYSAFISSSTLLDEFEVFTKSSAKAAKDIDFLKYFVKSVDAERRFGVPNTLEEIVLKDDMGAVKFFKKSDGTLISERRNGVVVWKREKTKLSDWIAFNINAKSPLIPNSVYKIRRENGTFCLCYIDEFGRLSKIETTGINSRELSSLIYAKDNVSLGPDWASKFKKIRETSKGGDIEANVFLKYTDDAQKPLAVKIDVKVKDKKLASESFENIDNLVRKNLSRAENAALLDKFAKRVNLSPKKRAKLLEEMEADEKLAELVHSNPEFNIQRWLNTRNSVDQSKVARTAKGRLVPNGRDYAGNVYYFNPHLNSKLKARLGDKGMINLKNAGQLNYNDLVKLDELYPNGVPFTKEGYPDFSHVAFKGKDGTPLRIDIKQLGEGPSGRKQDINLAETMYQKMGYPWKKGYTWHHVENSTCLIRIPTTIHQLVDHAGGVSTKPAQKDVRKAA